MSSNEQQKKENRKSGRPNRKKKPSSTGTDTKNSQKAKGVTSKSPNNNTNDNVVAASQQKTNFVSTDKKNKKSKKEQNDSKKNSNQDKERKSSESEPQKKKEATRKNRTRDIYDSYMDLGECLRLYHDNDCQGNQYNRHSRIIRGNIRFLPGFNPSKVNSSKKENNSENVNIPVAFVSCDKGSLKKDVAIHSVRDCNRSLHGDLVYVEIIEENLHDDDASDIQAQLNHQSTAAAFVLEEILEKRKSIQKKLWNPLVDTSDSNGKKQKERNQSEGPQYQRSGKVVHVVTPKGGDNSAPSSDKKASKPGIKIVVGTLKVLSDGNKTMFVPNNKCLPWFMTPSNMSIKNQKRYHKQTLQQNEEKKSEESISCYYTAEYKYGNWRENHVFPPCNNIKEIGQIHDIEVETIALLEEFGVNHGDFDPSVLNNVHETVKSGMFIDNDDNGKIGWKPTKKMYKGRRDFTNHRIFTIDPTTAKDLDDALHVTPLNNKKNQVEVGVHIADVSYFVTPDSLVDTEAKRRATSVYLVDRVIPMLPRPLCEIACSLNENVERLAFSCVWVMNPDGTLSQDHDVWYGRSVIKSCARLDYKTAQNLIEKKEAGDFGNLTEEIWPIARRPVPGSPHTLKQISDDVNLLNRIAKERRKLRFENGALTLNGVKLVFQLENDGTSPKLCEPYPIMDSNRLIEEYMLLANFLVAQRLITHAGDLALLRMHPSPDELQIGSVVDAVENVLGFTIDMTNSESLQKSLNLLGLRFKNDKLVIQSVTELLTLPMKQAVYFAAGKADDWSHFALNIPYYTHFTSPIRRYPDVIVHRLLQATLDGAEKIQKFPIDSEKINLISGHCNEKKINSKKASDRSDRVFLSLYLKKNPIPKVLGVVTSIGKTSFTVFVPSLGLSQMVFEAEHKELLNFHVIEEGRKIRVTSIQDNNRKGRKYDWNDFIVEIFTLIYVSCNCKSKPPIDTSLKIVGPSKEKKICNNAQNDSANNNNNDGLARLTIS